MGDRSFDPAFVQLLDDTLTPFPPEAFVGHVPATSEHGSNPDDHRKPDEADEQTTSKRPLRRSLFGDLRFWFDQGRHEGDSLNESTVTSIHKTLPPFRLQRAYNFRATGRQCHV